MSCLCITNIPILFFVEDRNVPFAEPPLLAFFEGRKNVLSSELIDRVRTHVQNNRNLFAVKQILFSFQHKGPPREFELRARVEESLALLTSSPKAVKASTLLLLIRSALKSAPIRKLTR